MHAAPSTYGTQEWPALATAWRGRCSAARLLSPPASGRCCPCCPAPARATACRGAEWHCRTPGGREGGCQAAIKSGSHSAHVKASVWSENERDSSSNDLLIDAGESKHEAGYMAVVAGMQQCDEVAFSHTRCMKRLLQGIRVGLLASTTRAHHPSACIPAAARSGIAQ